MKQCRCCKKEKNNEEFSVRLCNSDGLYSYCKECSRKDNRKRYEERKEQYSEINRKYKDKNKDILNKKSLDYYYENKEKVLARCAKYRQENKNKISLREAVRRISDKDRFEINRQRHLAWSKNNRDSINEYQREWYQKNKEKRRAHVILNRAIKSGKIVRPENCSECDKKCKPDGHHSDYTLPLDVIWICRACHSRKSIRTVIK